MIYRLFHEKIHVGRIISQENLSWQDYCLYQQSWLFCVLVLGYRRWRGLWGAAQGRVLCNCSSQNCAEQDGWVSTEPELVNLHLTSCTRPLLITMKAEVFNEAFPAGLQWGILGSFEMMLWFSVAAYLLVSLWLCPDVLFGLEQKQHLSIPSTKEKSMDTKRGQFWVNFG